MNEFVGLSVLIRIVPKDEPTGATFLRKLFSVQNMMELTRKLSSTQTSFHLKELLSIGSHDAFTGQILEKIRLKLPVWITQHYDQF